MTEGYSENHFPRSTGHLKQNGSHARFIGRILQQQTRDGILIVESQEDCTQILKGFGMTYCKEASTPTVMTTTLNTDSEEPLDSDLHSQYRIVVGQRQWEAPVRPDCAFTMKELARGLNEPTLASFRKLKHLLRYIKRNTSLQNLIATKTLHRSFGQTRLHLCHPSERKLGRMFKDTKEHFKCIDIISRCTSSL